MDHSQNHNNNGLCCGQIWQFQCHNCHAADRQTVKITTCTWIIIKTIITTEHAADESGNFSVTIVSKAWTPTFQWIIGCLFWKLWKERGVLILVIRGTHWKADNHMWPRNHNFRPTTGSTIIVHRQTLTVFNCTDLTMLITQICMIWTSLHYLWPLALPWFAVGRQTPTDTVFIWPSLSFEFGSHKSAVQKKYIKRRIPWDMQTM